MNTYDLSSARIKIGDHELDLDSLEAIKRSPTAHVVSPSVYRLTMRLFMGSRLTRAEIAALRRHDPGRWRLERMRMARYDRWQSVLSRP